MDQSKTSTTFVENESNPYDPILDELIEDAIWDVCFEVHRAVQCRILLVDDTEKKNYAQEIKAERKKQTNFSITCFLCKQSLCGTTFADHLGKDLGISGRNSSRTAKMRLTASIAASDDDSNSDSNSNESKKKRKKGNTSRKPAKRQANSIPKPSLTYADLEKQTYGERKTFFNKYCGAILKKGDKLCMNSLKCNFHADKRRDIRLTLLCRNTEMEFVNSDVTSLHKGIGDLTF